MKKFHFVAVVVTLMALVGCAKSADEGNSVEVAKTELSIGLPINLSRTAIDESGKASWTEGDTFSLWAENRTGGYSLNGANFTMMYYWHSLQSAVFTSQANALNEGEFTYYAVAPVPESYANNIANFTIPAVQQGDSFNGAYDVMVATPCQDEAILADKVNELALDFHHKMHTLKLTIPQGKNPFSEAISQIVFTFPTKVVGGASVSILDPASKATLSPTGNTLTINTPSGFNVGDVAWGVILPVAISGEVSYYAVSASGQLTNNRTFTLNKECKEGHITPLHITIPDPISPTVLRFAIGKNNLGEAVQKVTIIDHNGSVVKTFTGNSSQYDLIEYALFNNGTFKNYAGKTFTVRFESAHAIVETKVQIPSSLSKQGVNTINLDVPYLFYEDFTNIHTSFEKDDERVSNLMKADGMLLNNYMYVSGWNGAHIKGVAGKSVRVNVRHQSTGGSTRSNGRLDSPSMKNLKSGANVKLKVEFDMGAYVNSGYSSKNGVFCVAGIHSNAESTILNGVVETTVLSSVSNDAGRVAGEFSSVCLQTGNLSNNYNNDSFGSTFPTYSYTANNCSSATRLCWFPCSEQNNWTSVTNAHYYLYIDNVRVSIAQ
ncbi:MAG: fimbrillin family protein [Alistipes sp.]|nr:fimbrillin family protein [Alistipes sp.]